MILRSLYLILLGALVHTAHGQAILTTGDVEISTNFNPSFVGTATNPWRIGLRDGPALVEYAGQRQATADPERVIISAGLSAEIEVPDDPAFAFLGAPGRTVWILPEATDGDVVTPGFSTESRVGQVGWQGIGMSSDFMVRGIPLGSFLNNRITLTLASFSGPGDFFMYRLDGFGNPVFSFRSNDGLSAADSRNFTAATHTHFSWAFTAPGDYLIGLRASGTLTSGDLTQSDVTTFRFRVVPEPATAALLLTGLAVAATQRRRRGER